MTEREKLESLCKDIDFDLGELQKVDLELKFIDGLWEVKMLLDGEVPYAKLPGKGFTSVVIGPCANLSDVFKEVEQVVAALKEPAKKHAEAINNMVKCYKASVVGVNCVVLHDVKGEYHGKASDELITIALKNEKIF